MKRILEFHLYEEGVNYNNKLNDFSYIRILKSRVPNKEIISEKEFDIIKNFMDGYGLGKAGRPGHRSNGYNNEIRVWDKFRVDLIDKKEIKFFGLSCDFSISKDSDYYYYLTFKKGGYGYNSKFYKCDEIKGLLSLLKFIFTDFSTRNSDIDNFIRSFELSYAVDSAKKYTMDKIKQMDNIDILLKIKKLIDEENNFKI